MMLKDDEAPLNVDRKVWTHEWILRGEQPGAYHTIFREPAIEDTGLGLVGSIRECHTKICAREIEISQGVVHTSVV